MPRISIHSDPPVDLPTNGTYEERHALLSSRERRLTVRYGEETLVHATVPAGVFNPSIGIAAHRLLELIVRGRLPVAGKEVVDLGCGSGVIGLTCIRQGAARVLFTDRNPAVGVLASHPDLRSQDRVAVQDFLAGEPEASQDVVIMSTPTAARIDHAEPGFRETNIGAADAFLPDLAREAARVLRPGGHLYLWLSMLIGAARMQAFVDALVPGFQADSLTILDPPPEQAGQQNWVLLSIERRGCG